MWHHQAVETIQHMIMRYRMTPTAQTRMVINSSWQEVQKEMNALIKEIEVKHKKEEKDALADSQKWQKIFR
jgi:hypothetical protein